MCFQFLISKDLEWMLNIPYQKPEEDTKKTATIFLLLAAKFLEVPAVGSLTSIFEQVEFSTSNSSIRPTYSSASGNTRTWQPPPCAERCLFLWVFSKERNRNKS